MKYFFLIGLFAVTGFTYSKGQGIVRKIDTTVKVGVAGYRVACNNKSPEKNVISVKPVGFDNEARETQFFVKGRVEHVEIDDFNNDGFPDLIIYSLGGPMPTDYVNVYIILSQGNKSFMAAYFPDLLDDAKLREGYKGQDQFNLMEGTVLRSFPIFKPEDSANKPTGGKRVIQYKMMFKDGGYRFKVIRTYETK